MRYLLILLFFIFLILPGKGVAQNILDQKITKNLSSLTLNQALEELENDYTLKFYYKQEWIDGIIIDRTSINMTIREFVTMNLDPHELSIIEIQGRNVVLVPSGFNYLTADDELSLIKPVGNPLEKGKYHLNKVEGHVYFGKNGDPIPGAIIFDKKNEKQTVSDYNGYYSLNLPGGLTELEFSFIGLETNHIPIEIFSPGKLDCDLMEASIQIDAINVMAHGGKNNVERTQMGVVHLEMKALTKLPVLMGETDIVKSMTLLPGVQTPGEMSSGFNVRGGNVDQNYVFVDGVPFYNTSHLFGLFSTLIPNAVSNVNLHKGTQPANYGGRLSSVMDIELKEPDTAKIGGKASIGIINSSLFIEGPVYKDKLSFFVGGRTTYSNWLLKTVPDIDIENSESSFYDLIGKLNYKINNKHKVDFYGYYSHDYFKYSTKNSYEYGSLNGGLNYRWFMNQDFTMYFNAAYSDYNNDFAYFEDPSISYIVNTGIKQYLSKLEFNWHLDKHSFLFGAEGSAYNINPGVKSKYNEESKSIPSYVNNEEAIEFAGFIHDDYSITKELSLMVGLRYSWYSKQGPSTTLIYDPNQSVSANTVIDSVNYGDNDLVEPYGGFEPRISARYAMNEWSSVKAGYHLSRQYQHLISNSSSSTPSDYWKTVDDNIKPMKSQQFSLGYFRNFSNNVIETSAELYYKTVENSLEYRNGAVLVMNPYIEQDVLPGSSRAYGLELMVKKSSGKLNGWVSYTLSRSEIKVDGQFSEDKINGGSYYPTYNDRLHDLSVSMSYQFTRRWTFAGNFILISGRPTTYPEKKYEYRNAEVVYFSDRNKYRLPSYNRLDVSLTYEGILKKSKKVHPSFTFSLYNLYGRNNVYSTYYKQDVPSAKNDYNRYGLYKLSIIGAPIPSVTVNLKF